MIRLKYVELFQDIRVGPDRSYMKCFSSDAAGVEYRNQQCKADLVLEPDTGLLYIREMHNKKVHICSVNNLKECVPIEADLPDVFVAEVKPTTYQFATVPEIVKKRMGRPPKVRGESASNPVT